MLLIALIVFFVLVVCDSVFAASTGHGADAPATPSGSVIQLPPGFDVGLFFLDLLKIAVPIVSVAALIAGFVVLSKTLKRL